MSSAWTPCTFILWVVRSTECGHKQTILVSPLYTTVSSSHVMSLSAVYSLLSLNASLLFTPLFQLLSKKTYLSHAELSGVVCLLQYI
jgi:hypothetical protein